MVTREAKPEFFAKYNLPADAPVKIVHDLGEVLDDYNSEEEEEEELFVIGGGTIYLQSWQSCSKLYLTEVNKEFPKADTFFPEFNKSLYEREVVGAGEDNGAKYEFVVYTKKESL